MEKKRPIQLSWIAVLVVVAVLCFGAYQVARRIVDSRSSRLHDVVTLPATATQVIQPLGSGILYFDGGSLHAIDQKGRQTWSYPAGSLARFDTGRGGIATWTGATVALLNEEDGSQLFSRTLESNIISAKLGREYAAVQIEKPGNSQKALTDAQREHNTSMLILDRGGRQVQQIELSNQMVLDYGFFSNDQLFWTLTLDTEGTVPLCIITSYKPGRTMFGNIRDYEQVLYHAMFLPSRIRVTGETHIKDFDDYGKEITQNRILVYGWKMVDVDETQPSPIMAFVPNNQADGTVGITDIRAIRDQSDTTIRLPTEAKQVFVKGDTIYAFSYDTVMICRSGAIEAERYLLPRQIDKVIALTEGPSAIATSGGEVLLIPLR